MSNPQYENRNDEQLLHGGQRQPAGLEDAKVEATGAPTKPTALAALRLFAPKRLVSFQTALAVAEQQADEFLRLSGIDPASVGSTGGVPTTIVENLPRFRVVREDIPESGMTRRAGGVWLILVSKHEAPVRNRFTTFHEFKHALDHHQSKFLYTGRHWLPGAEREADAARQRERAADFFAGCVLMPRAALAKLWREGVREAEDIAARCNVSPAAAQVRLEQLGFVRARWMCSRGLDPNLSVHDLPPTPSWPPLIDRPKNEIVAEALETMHALGLRRPHTNGNGLGRPRLHSRTGSRTITTPRASGNAYGYGRRKGFA